MTTFLNNEEISAKAPSVMQQTPKAGLSDHYVHIPTSELIDDMKKLNWGVVDVKEVRTRKNDRQGFQKHLVVFRHESLKITNDAGDVVYPQLLLTNSHDGLSAFTFRAGLFRLVCTNGLVISDKDFANMSIRHKGYSFEALQQSVKTMVEQLPLTVESLNKMQEVVLTEEQQIELALRSIGVRFGKELASVEPMEVLKPERQEDEGDDLWRVFNRIQEKMTRGGVKYKSEKGRNKTVRSIKNFNRDIELNEQLFALAMEYVG